MNSILRIDSFLLEIVPMQQYTQCGRSHLTSNEINNSGVCYQLYVHSFQRFDNSLPFGNSTRITDNIRRNNGNDERLRETIERSEEDNIRISSENNTSFVAIDIPSQSEAFKIDSNFKQICWHGIVSFWIKIYLVIVKQWKQCRSNRMSLCKKKCSITKLSCTDTTML